MKSFLFRATTGIAGVYHLILGAALWLLPPGTLEGVAKVFLGVGVEADDRITLIARFSSAYILAFGVMLALLCLNPVRHRALAIPALTLFGIRIINKLVLLGSIEQAFQVSRGRSVFAVATLAVIFSIIAATLPSIGKSKQSES